MSTKLPSIPSIPANLDNNLRTTLESMKEIIEVKITGTRGDPLDTVPSIKDLASNGVVSLRSTNTSAVASEVGTEASIEFRSNNTVDSRDALPLTVPAAPVNVTASLGVTVVVITWARPIFSNFAFAEVFRAPVNAIGQAESIATTSSNFYTEDVGFGNTFYYWVRFVNTGGIAGPFQDTNGIEAVVPTNAIQAANIGSINADTITTGTLSAGVIGAGTIEADKLVLDGVTMQSTNVGGVNKLAVLEIQTANIADAAISTAKIDTAQVNSLKLGDSVIFVPLFAGTPGATDLSTDNDIAFEYNNVSQYGASVNSFKTLHEVSVSLEADAKLLIEARATLDVTNTGNQNQIAYSSRAEFRILVDNSSVLGLEPGSGTAGTGRIDDVTSVSVPRGNFTGIGSTQTTPVTFNFNGKVIANVSGGTIASPTTSTIKLQFQLRWKHSNSSGSSYWQTYHTGPIIKNSSLLVSVGKRGGGVTN